MPGSGDRLRLVMPAFGIRLSDRREILPAKYGAAGESTEVHSREARQ